MRLWLFLLVRWLWSLDNFLQPSANCFLFLNNNRNQLSLACWYCSFIRGFFFLNARKDDSNHRILYTIKPTYQWWWRWFHFIRKFFLWTISHVLFPAKSVNQKREKNLNESEILKINLCNTVFIGENEFANPPLICWSSN